jgi:hypothetical protein
MFEQALILRAGLPRNVDIGLLAETLLFYGSVHLLLDHRSLIALAKDIPSAELLSLLDRDTIKVSYLRQMFGVMKFGMPPEYDFCTLKFSGNEGQPKRINYREEIQTLLEKKLGKSVKTKKLAQSLADRVKLQTLSDIPERDNAITDQARADVRDLSFLREAVAITLRDLVPDYKIPNAFRFDFFNTGERFAIDTDLNFEAINAIYHQTVSKEHSSIDPSFLLTRILEARADTFFAAYYMAEPVTTPVYSDISKLKHFEFLRRRELNTLEIEQFQDMVLRDFSSIRETLNGGHRTFAEFLTLLDKADEFKHWIRVTNPDVGLLQSYLREVTENTWADRLPGKALRLSIATGLGLIPGVGPGLGFAESAFDTLMLDRLAKGWRPNRFIQGPYRKFLEPR